MRPNAPYFIILFIPMPDDFTYQGEDSATQSVNFDSGSSIHVPLTSNVF